MLGASGAKAQGDRCGRDRLSPGSLGRGWQGRASVQGGRHERCVQAHHPPIPPPPVLLGIGCEEQEGLQWSPFPVKGCVPLCVCASPPSGIWVGDTLPR